MRTNRADNVNLNYFVPEKQRNLKKYPDVAYWV